MKSHNIRFPKNAGAFVLVPVLFNLVMWQNYPVSAQCLMPDVLLNMGMRPALLVFGLGFGLFTSLVASICFFSCLNMQTVLRKLRINNYVRRHQSLYAALWMLTFTLGSFAGFLLIICVRYHAETSNIYLSGSQGFLIAGIGAGALGVVIATVWSSLLDQARKHLFKRSNTLTECNGQTT